MKELSIEQKLRDIEVVKQMIADGHISQDVAEKYFPEIKESEDELTWLKNYISEEAYCLSMDIRDDEDRIKLKKLQNSLAWLKKQGDKDKLIQELGKYKVKYTQEVLENYINSMGSKEDERIRKALISILKSDFEKDTTIFDISVEQILAWLEKQGEQKPVEWSEEDKRCINQLIIFCENCMVQDTNVKKCTNWLKSLKGRIQSEQSNKTQGVSKSHWKPTEEQYEALVYAYNSCSDTERGNYYEGVLETLIEDLHRLDEQHPKFKIGDTIKKKSTGDIVTISVVDLKNREYKLSNTGFIPFKYEYLWELIEQKPTDNDNKGESEDIKQQLMSEITDLATDYIKQKSAEWGEENEHKDKKQSEKKSNEEYNITGIKSKHAEGKLGEMIKKTESADKTEPKFKVGDWVIGRATENEPRQIAEVLKEGYITTYGGWIGFSFEKDMHLWTIEDAKDGDVLATRSFIFIFKSIDNNNGVHYYCHYEINKHEDDNQFGIALPQSLMGRVGDSFTHYSPATKVQHDFLFKGVKENGYEWDAENKKLRPI